MEGHKMVLDVGRILAQLGIATYPDWLETAVTRLDGNAERQEDPKQAEQQISKDIFLPLELISE